MGLLLDPRSARLIALSAHTLIGRSSACLIVLDDPRASAEHAAITWSGQHWEARDLGSLNGTWLDGRRLTAGERAPVRRAARVAFGGGAPWILVDDLPVGPTARNEATAETVHAASGMLALPSPAAPCATIYLRPDGTWMVELGNELRAIANGDAVDLGDTLWSVFLPDHLGPLPQTLKEGTALLLGDIDLTFVPSQDEEHVDVRARTDDGKELEIPARSSHYLLLTLARARLRDARAGISVDEQGWMYATDLADMLHYTAERFNLEIFRSRSQFAKLGFVDAPRLIERRTTTRQLRLGVARLRVTPR